MQTDRHTILSLIAAGRITPVEAERLLVLSNERAETLLALAACLGVALLVQGSSHLLWPEVLRSLKTMLTEFSAVIFQMQVFITQVWGGIL
jgi:hypothetical protein